MCKWLEDVINFWFPEPAEMEMDGEKEADIEPVSDVYDWDAGFTLKIPGFYRVDPAVKEAELLLRGKSISHFIPDGRVVR